MSSFRQSSCFAGFLAALALYASSADAAPPALVVPLSGHPSASIGITGHGFGASEAIDIYFDTTDEMLVVSTPTGAIARHNLSVPSAALPGVHWVTAIGRRDGNAAQRAFTVSTNWAEHGFDQRGRRNNPYENAIGISNVGTLDVAWQYLTGGAVLSS